MPPLLSVCVVVALLLCMGDALPTDDQLFQALDLNLPQLSTVKQYYQAKNIPAAKTALAKYYRERPAPAYYDNYAIICEGNDIMSTADQVVKGEIFVLNYGWTFPNAAIDWSFNPTKNNPQISYSPEWQWAVNRQCFWPNLGQAYAETNNSIYAETFAKQIASWAQNCPKPNTVDNGVGSEWRTIEAGIRTGYSWPDAWLRFKNAPELDDNTLLMWVKSFLDHGNYLHAFHTGGNWETMEMNGLFSVGSFFPEFQDAQTWRQFASKALYSLMQGKFLADGGWEELTTGYAQVSINNIAWLYHVSLLFDTSKDVPAGYTDTLLKALTWDIDVMTPAGLFPLVNDAWDLYAVDEGKIGLQLFPDNDLMRWLASNRTQGTAPSYTSVYLPNSGYIAMRTGWTFGDTYAFFDVAPLGAGHYHQDKLNLLIDSWGRRLLYDGGGGQYNDDKWRTYATSTASHNTIIVDGQNQNRPAPSHADPLGKGDPNTPAPIWQTTKDVDYGCGYYIDSYGAAKPAQHRREVAFWKTNVQAFVVVDTLTPTDDKPHTYEATWNFLSTKYYIDQKLKVVSTNDSSLPNLAIVSLSNETLATYVALNTSTEIRGWDIDRNPPFNIPALEVIHSLTNKAGKQQFVTLLLPLEAGITQHTISHIETVSQKNYVVYFNNGYQLSIMLGNDIGVKLDLSKAN